MAYVVTTFFAMVSACGGATSLGRPVRGVTAAWIGFAVCLAGTLMAVVIVLSGAQRSSTLLSTAARQRLVLPRHPVAGRRLDDLVVLMIYNMVTWKRDNPVNRCRFRCSRSPRRRCSGPGPERRHDRTRGIVLPTALA